MLQITDMSDKLIFIVSSPRSGSTLLERMISAHSKVVGGPEPHLLTPLAHLGYYENIEKAPYDHLRAVAAQREFVAALPDGEKDYITALQAYCFHLYGRQLEAAGDGKERVLDKTPAYALVLPFITKIFPRAKYVLLARHPAAIFASYAQSFFENDWKAAHDYNPIIERYVPAMARFIRETKAPFIHIRYEDLVTDPEKYMQDVSAFLELPYEPQTVEYGSAGETKRKGLGDPIGVDQHKRPVTSSVDKWVKTVDADVEKQKLLEKMIGFCDPEDFRTLGYDPNMLFEPLEVYRAKSAQTPTASGEKKKKKSKKKMNAFSWERRLLHIIRQNIHKNWLGKLLRKIRFTCDVLLR
ncbi:MAG: sulfotransferase [bacterium]